MTDSTVRPRAHLLTITADPERRKGWQFTVTCPYTDVDLEAWRPCATWIECGCHLTEDEREALEADDKGTCPESPTGLHHASGSPGLSGPQYPVPQCRADTGEYTADAASEVHAVHGCGTYAVGIGDESKYVDFVVLAGIERAGWTA